MELFVLCNISKPLVCIYRVNCEKLSTYYFDDILKSTQILIKTLVLFSNIPESVIKYARFFIENIFFNFRSDETKSSYYFYKIIHNLLFFKLSTKLLRKWVHWILFQLEPKLMSKIGRKTMCSAYIIKSSNRICYFIHWNCLFWINNK